MSEFFMKKYQYFKCFLLCATLLGKSVIYCSEKEESKKSTIITRAVKAAIIGLPIFQAMYQYTNYSSKPCGIDKYPHVQTWYGEMSEKYPVANLHSSELCEDVLWASAGNRIFFPTTHLQAIDSIYSKKANNQTLVDKQMCLALSSTSDMDNKILNMNEFILLHEAGHRKNGDTSRVNVGLDIAKKTVVTALGAMVTTSPVGAGAASMVDGVGNIVRSWSKEEQADKFACDHAQNTDVLMGGLSFLNYLTEQANLAAERVNVDPIGFVRSIDPLHPHSQQRAQKVVDEIHRRWVIDNTCSSRK